MQRNINHQDTCPILRERGILTLKVYATQRRLGSKGSHQDSGQGGSHNLGSDTKTGGAPEALQRCYAKGTHALPEVAPQRGGLYEKHGSLRPRAGCPRAALTPGRTKSLKPQGGRTNRVPPTGKETSQKQSCPTTLSTTETFPPCAAPLNAENVARARNSAILHFYFHYCTTRG